MTTDFVLTNEKDEYYLKTTYIPEYDIECATVNDVINTLKELDGDLPLAFATTNSSKAYLSKLIIKQGKCYVLLDKKDCINFRRLKE